MPPRDEQEYEQRRQQIIDGALAVFAEKGFEKATNKDIADAAQIGSPGLIYHYFKDKTDLLYNVIHARVPMIRLIDDAETILQQPPREALHFILKTFASVTGHPTAMRVFRLLMGEALRRPSLAKILNDIGPGRVLPIVAAYLERLMDAGVLRRADPHAAARTLIGPLLAYLITREVFQQPDALTLDPDLMAETAVDIFWRGMAIDPDGTAGS